MLVLRHTRDTVAPTIWQPENSKAKRFSIYQIYYCMLQKMDLETSVREVKQKCDEEHRQVSSV